VVIILSKIWWVFLTVQRVFSEDARYSGRIKRIDYPAYVDEKCDTLLGREVKYWNFNNFNVIVIWESRAS
jgi:hypothetical protein